MGFLWFGKKQNKVQNTVQNPNATTLGGSNESFIFDLVDSDTEYKALKLSAVYSAISIISNTMSKIPFYIIDGETKERVKNRNLDRLLNLQPNDKMNIVMMNKMVWQQLAVSGNAYLLPIRKPRSTEIIAIKPLSNVSIVTDSEDNLFYDVTLKQPIEGKKTLRLRYDEIIHLKWNSEDGVNGVSPLDYAKNTIQTGLNQEEFAKAFYENGGRPDGVLMTQADLSSKPAVTKTITKDNGATETVTLSLKDIMREEWKKAHTGKKRFSTAILDNGLQYHPITQISPEQMQFVSSKEVNVEDIARFFDMGSCSFKLGVGKQTYSNNEQGQICYVTECIVPKLRQWEKELTLKLLTAEEQEKGYEIKGNIEVELRGDTRARANWYDKMRSMGVYNINEIRAYEDLPSIGTDGETRLIGANSIPLERLLSGGTTAEVTPNPISQPNEEVDEGADGDEQQPENKRFKKKKEKNQ